MDEIDYGSLMLEKLLEEMKELTIEYYNKLYEESLKHNGPWGSPEEEERYFAIINSEYK